MEKERKIKKESEEEEEEGDKTNNVDWLKQRQAKPTK